MSIEASAFAAILAMACATILTRLSGLYLMNRLRLGPRGRKVLGAVPPAVLMALVAPVALATGIAETAAAAVTAFAALRLPLLAATALGVLTAALFRALGWS
ncbi:AzlD family protein [Rhizobium sp. C1]|uniref:AzlD family protein n=1 Tax=Rhizobium sp. C1 TaxID=1349799 RepID=UPI001E28BBCE|nr:AzlD domain-containing protein [Rhizobium sp. C1]MCD2177615.1 AzlD domain-containing protein [Rhizobium sp. C1]